MESTNSLQLFRTIDLSILDLKGGNTQEIMEMQCQEKVEVEVQDLISPTEPLEKKENSVSTVEETDTQEKARDKVTAEITNSKNH